jgi:hypothetical protein
MILFGIAAAIGLIARAVSGTETQPLRFRWLGLLGVALIGQIAIVPRLGDPARALALTTTIAAATLWLVLNVVSAKSHTVRVALCGIALGAAMNAIPILQYGSMPVERNALHAIGYDESDNTGERGAKHVIVDGAPLLGDRFALRPIRAVASLGDFVELGAVALLISAIPRRRRSSLPSPVVR